MIEASDLVRIIGSRAYVFSNGVWVDTAFDPQQMQTVKVAFLSDDYFALSSSRPDLAAAFALGEKVIALSQGTAYEIMPAGSVQPGILLLPSGTPTGVYQLQPVTPAPGTVIPATTISGKPVSGPSSTGLPCASALLPLLLGLAALYLAHQRR
jgi:hypothetical protein